MTNLEGRGGAQVNTPQRHRLLTSRERAHYDGICFMRLRHFLKTGGFLSSVSVQITMRYNELILKPPKHHFRLCFIIVFR